MLPLSCVSSQHLVQSQHSEHSCWMTKRARMLSRFSPVSTLGDYGLWAMGDYGLLWTVAHQAPLSMGILQAARIRNGLPFPSPGMNKHLLQIPQVLTLYYDYVYYCCVCMLFDSWVFCLLKSMVIGFCKNEWVNWWEHSKAQLMQQFKTFSSPVTLLHLLPPQIKTHCLNLTMGFCLSSWEVAGEQGERARAPRPYPPSVSQKLAKEWVRASVY